MDARMTKGRNYCTYKGAGAGAAAPKPAVAGAWAEAVRSPCGAALEKGEEEEAAGALPSWKMFCCANS